MKPSVTQLLHGLVDFHCSPAELERYAEDGREKHSLVKMYWDTRLILADADLGGLLRVVPWLAEFHDFILPYGPPGKYEERLECEEVTGKPDMVFAGAIMDLKRSFLNPRYHALQLAGYYYLLKKNKLHAPKDWIIVWYDDGFKCRNVYDPRAEQIFLALLKKWQIDQAVNTYMTSL